MPFTETDHQRLHSAYEIAKADLIAERSSEGCWIGELSSSPLSTATAISALVISGSADAVAIESSLRWLANQQNEDGGWGDTDLSLSNIATTMLVRAAFQLTAEPAGYKGLLARADNYIANSGGIAGLRRRYGKDKTFAAPILANYALAGLIPWKQVPALPFELACVPQSWYRLVKMPVVSYAIPALVAIGQAKFHHDRPRLLPQRMLRQKSVKKSLHVLEQMQPLSGGFLEAIPLTSFVVMSLASTGRPDHAVVRRGIGFLKDSMREDGSWPIDTNLATWNTTLAVNALVPDVQEEQETSEVLCDATLDWLLNCQHTEPHPYTGAAPGGWAWTNLSGGVPDADDTPSALLALSKWRSLLSHGQRRDRIDQAAQAGVCWLLDLQNRDGGWPTFCRGWGTLPFDRSACDLTAHALRALYAWSRIFREDTKKPATALETRIQAAVTQGLRFLTQQQQKNGSWLPLWFGNQHNSDEVNPVYGAAKVLLMCDELGLGRTAMAQRAVGWLADNQLTNGGWGPARASDAKLGEPNQASVEETALAVTALLPFCEDSSTVNKVVDLGLKWLVVAVEEGRHREPSPIGFYFAKLWYYERLYPQIFVAEALTRAVAQRTCKQSTDFDELSVHRLGDYKHPEAATF